MSSFSDAKIPERALERVDVSKLRPFDLMVLAIAERGAPMSLEAIRDRLAQRGREVSVLTLQKAWHGRPPLRRTVSGDMELVPELDPIALSLVIWRVQELLGEAPWRKALESKDPPIDRRAPVTLDELRIAGRVGVPWSLSSGRLIGMVIEAAGRPLTADEVASLMKDVGFRVSETSLRTCGYNRESPVRRTDGGLWTVDSAAPSLLDARRVVREIVRRERRREDNEAAAKSHSVEFRDRERAERRADELRWLTSTKRLIRTLYVQGELAAAALLDPDGRTFTFATSAGEARAALEGVELVIGIDPRSELERLGAPTAGRRFDDLSPPAKSRRVGATRRVLRITPELILRHTLGDAGRLSDPERLASHARAGQMDEVRAGLESDLKVLYALHDYVHGHGCVRLRHGNVEEVLDMPWQPVGGTPRLLSMLKHARYDARTIEVVLYEPPPWDEPWSRAIRCEVSGIDRWHLTLTAGRWRTVAWFPEIYAARVVERGAGRASG